MENSKNRNRANVVAIACLVLESLSFVGILFYIGRWLVNEEEMLQHMTMDLNTPNGPNKEEHVELLRKAIWVVFSLALIFAVVKAYAAYLLYKGTRVETEISVSMKYCRNWKIVTIVYLVLQALSVLAYGFTLTAGLLVLFCIKDGVFLYIVGCFSDELGAALRGNAYSKA